MLFFAFCQFRIVLVYSQRRISNIYSSRRCIRKKMTYLLLGFLNQFNYTRAAPDGLFTCRELNPRGSRDMVALKTCGI